MTTKINTDIPTTSTIQVKFPVYVDSQGNKFIVPGTETYPDDYPITDETEIEFRNIVSNRMPTFSQYSTDHSIFVEFDTNSQEFDIPIVPDSLDDIGQYRGHEVSVIDILGDVKKSIDYTDIHYISGPSFNSAEFNEDNDTVFGQSQNTIIEMLNLMFLNNRK